MRREPAIQIHTEARTRSPSLFTMKRRRPKVKKVVRFLSPRSFWKDLIKELKVVDNKPATRRIRNPARDHPYSLIGLAARFHNPELPLGLLPLEVAKCQVNASNCRSKAFNCRGSRTDLIFAPSTRSTRRIYVHARVLEPTVESWLKG